MTTQAQELAQQLSLHSAELQKLLSYSHPGEELTTEDIFLALQEAKGETPNLDAPLSAGSSTKPIPFESFKSSLLTNALKILLTTGGACCLSSTGVQRAPRFLTTDAAALSAMRCGRVETIEFDLYEPLARWVELVLAPKTHISHVPASGKKESGRNPDILGIPVSQSRYLKTHQQPCDLVAIEAKPTYTPDTWRDAIAKAVAYQRFANRSYVAFPLNAEPVGLLRFFDKTFIKEAVSAGVGVLAVIPHLSSVCLPLVAPLDWDWARVCVVLDAEPRATALPDAEEIVEHAWHFLGQRKQVLAAFLRKQLGTAMIWKPEMMHAARDLNAYDSSAGIVGHVSRRRLEDVLERWEGEIMRLFNKPAREVAFQWGVTIDAHYECDCAAFNSWLFGA